MCIQQKNKPGILANSISELSPNGPVFACFNREQYLSLEICSWSQFSIPKVLISECAQKSGVGTGKTS